MTPQQQLRPAAPAKLIVFFAFMIQFIALLLGLGGLVPYLHVRGIHLAILAVGAVAAFSVLQVVLGFTPSGKSRSAAGPWTGAPFCSLCFVDDVSLSVQLQGLRKPNMESVQWGRWTMPMEPSHAYGQIFC